MSETFKYRDEDVVLVGWPTSGGPPECASTMVNCHKCGQLVWVSHASMNTVLDAKTKAGGELYITCLMCAPEMTSEDHELQLGDEQKEEMLRAGLDIDDFMRRTGMNLTEIARMVVEKAKRLEELKTLHRAANPGPDGCGNPRCRVCFPDQMEDGGAWEEFKMDLPEDAKPGDPMPGGGLIGDIGDRAEAFIKGVMGRQEPGAILNGRRVRKINTEKGDKTPEGTEGVVMGSVARPNLEPHYGPEGQVVLYGYFIKWDGDPMPVFTTNLKVEEV